MKLFASLVSAFIFTFCALIPSVQANSEWSDTVLVYKFSIKEEIAQPIWRKTKKAIEEAHALNADLIFIEMNTYGGLVDMADSIRTKILNAKMPVYILIENNAASAGALISLACDSIYMQPGSTIGAATVVNQSGEAVPDKYQSYMRKKMRATAEQNGRNPDIAEAMVDPDKEVPGVSEKGKVVTFTTTEAIEHGFCEAELANMKDVFQRIGIEDYQLVSHKESTVDKVIGFLINPMVSGILIMVLVFGIYFELQSPGIGFPLIASLIAATLYFAPLYLEGMAENWEIILFGIGVVLLLVEVFVIPGFGVAGVSGIALIITGLTLALVGNVGFNFEPVNPDAFVRASFIVVMSLLTSVGGSIFLGVKFFNSSAFRFAILESSQKVEDGFVATDTSVASLIGEKGSAFTVLRPSGKVKIGSEIHDATALTGGFIDKGDEVVVVKMETAQLFVEKA